MTFRVIHGPTRAALAAATSQTTQINALVAPWAGGGVRVRVLGTGGVLRQVATLGPWTVESTTPRQARCGARTAWTASSTGDIDRLEFRLLDETPIFSIDAQAGAGAAAIDFIGAIKAACPIDLAGVVITAQAALPVTSLPAWLAGAAVGQWATISGTTCPAILDDYCGVAIREDGTAGVQVWHGASGGHGGNLTDNIVQSIRLDVNSPAWTTLRAADSSAGWDITGATSALFPNGKPAPRHTYYDVAWEPTRGQFIVGGRFYGSGANDWPVRHAFDPATNDWITSLANVTAGSGVNIGARRTVDGVWYASQGYKWTPGTDTHATWSISGAEVNRGAFAYDPSRDQFFHLSAGNNFDAGGGTIRSAKVSPAGTSAAIGFNASAGWTQFQTDAASADFWGVALEYDPDLDRFYFFAGLSGSTSRVYVITPNSGSTWDMAILSVTGVTPPAFNGQGVYRKFFYSSTLKACVLIAPSALIHFVRTQ